MSKCKCYHTQNKLRYTYDPITRSPIPHDTEVGVCWGTKECDECRCGGDESKCDFYPEVRAKADKAQDMSNEEKQIEEMANITKVLCEIDNSCGSCHWETCNECLAECLYKAGYRKASDVAREIVEELTRMVFSKIPNKLLLISGGRDFTDGIIDGKREAYFDTLNYLAELKKKYESEGGNERNSNTNWNYFTCVDSKLRK